MWPWTVCLQCWERALGCILVSSVFWSICDRTGNQAEILSMEHYSTSGEYTKADCWILTSFCTRFSTPLFPHYDIFTMKCLDKGKTFHTMLFWKLTLFLLLYSCHNNLMQHLNNNSLHPFWHCSCHDNNRDFIPDLSPNILRCVLGALNEIRLSLH